MSADLHTDLTIELVVKNYPKMTPHTSKSLHWIKSYVDFSPKLIKMLLQMWLQTSVGELVQIQPRPRGGGEVAGFSRIVSCFIFVSGFFSDNQN